MMFRDVARNDFRGMFGTVQNKVHGVREAEHEEKTQSRGRTDSRPIPTLDDSIVTEPGARYHSINPATTKSITNW